VKLLGGFPATNSPTLNDRNWNLNPTILSGNIGNVNDEKDNAFHVVSILDIGSSTPTPTTLDGFIVSDGYADDRNDVNNSYNSGGGIYIYGNSPVIQNCILKNNFGRLVGGVFVAFSSPTISNCQFYDNRGNTAAIKFENSSPNLKNCTFYSASTRLIESASGANVTIVNSIIWGNDTPVGNTGGGTGISYSIVQGGYAGTGNLGIDPDFLEPANGNFRVNSRSCAIDGGTNAVVGSGETDFDKNPRIYNSGTVDMGAYEYQGTREIVSLITTTNNALHFDGTNDYVSLIPINSANCTSAPLTLSNALTIEYWFKGTNLQSAVRFQNGSDYISAGWGTAGSFKHILSNSGGVDGVSVGAAATDGNWHHVAMTWQKGVVNGFKSYLDGQLVQQKDATNTDLPSFSGGLALGSLNGVSEFMNGSLEEVRVWNVARTQAEIKSGMCSLSLPQTGLLMYYRFDHGVVNGNNASVTSLANSAATGVYTGNLNGFALDGSTSNWVASPTKAPIRYVKQGGTGDGSSWANASGNLQAMIDAVCVEQVWVAAGTYKPTSSSGCSNCSSNQEYYFLLKDGVKVYGGFAGTETSLVERNITANPTILSGDLNENDGPNFTNNSDNTYHVVVAASANTNSVIHLDGFTVKGGNANGSGTSLINGQGVEKYYGGGIYVKGGTVSLMNNITEGNRALSNGGGVYINSATSTLVNHTAIRNQANSNGGGVYISNGTNTLINNLIVGNTANDGGGIHTVEGSNSLTNTTIAGNEGYNGAGMRMFLGANTLTNSIVWGNSNNSVEQIISIGSTVNMVNSIVKGGFGGSLNIDPLFVDPVNNDYRLQAKSCAINAGNNAALPMGITTDRAGAPRLFNGGTIDMGAFEFQGDKQTATPNLPPITTNNALNFDGSNDFVSIVAADLANCATAPLTLDDFTIEYWFKGTDIRSAVFLGKGTNFISSGYGAAGTPRHVVYYGGNSTSVAVGPGAVDGNWHHIAMTWKKGTVDGLKSYLDGELVEKQLAPGYPFPAFDSDLFLGFNKVSSEYTNGSLDELRVWNVVRTQEEIKASICGDLSLPQTGLLMYYKFDHGVPNASNGNASQLLNSANPNTYVGTLTNFALNGTTSNWTAPAKSPIRYVKQGGTGDGSSWANASGNLQAMIDAVCVEQVWVAAGTYKPGTRASDYFSMKEGVKIYGGFPATGNPTMADRNWKTNVTILSGDLNGDDVITGSGKTLTITNNRENSISVVRNYYKGLTNENSLLDGFTIRGGSAYDDHGGGMSNNNSSPSLSNIVFLGNYGAPGAGISNIESSPRLVNVIFYNNKATIGGGMENVRSSPSLINVVFCGNLATNGGGINNFLSSPNMTNVTFLDNYAVNNGAGINTIESSSPIIKNAIFWGNKKGNETISSIDGEAATVTYSVVEQATSNYTGTGNINQDPFFVNASDPDGADNIFGTDDDGLRLSACSQAINVGDNAGVATTDIVGNSRIFGAVVDMGAYEYQSAPPTGISPTVSVTSPTTCGGTNGSLKLGGFLSNTSYSVTYKKDNVAVAAASFTSNGSGEITLTGLGIGMYSDIVARYGACVSNAAAGTITNPGKPTITLGNPSTICANATSFSIPVANTTGSPTKYSITGAGVTTISDGDLSNLITVALSSPASGSSISFKLTVKSLITNCVSDDITGAVTVNPLSVGGAVNTAQTICSGAIPVDLSLSGQTGSVVKWQKSSDANFTNAIDIASTATTLPSATIGSLTADTYFRAMVKSGVCSEAYSSSALIQIHRKPTVTLSTLQQTLNEGNNQIFCDTDANPVNSLQFNLTNGCVVGAPVWRVQVGNGAWSDWSTSQPVTQLSNNQPYRYQAACDASCPVTYTSPITVQINYRASTPQQVSLVADGVTVSEGESKDVCNIEGNVLIFSATCATGEVLLYSVDGGDYNGVIPTQLVDVQYHNYRVRCRKSDGTPSCIESESGVMRLKLTNGLGQVPVASLNVTSGCGTPVSFSGTVSCGSLTTVWYNASTNVALATLPSQTPTETTSYYARCQAGGGCLSEKSNVVTYTVIPVGVAPVVTASQEIVCLGTSVTLSANCPSGSQTFWNTGVTTPSFEVSFNNVTKQTYWAKCLFAGGCQSAESVKKEVYWNAFVVTLINVGESKSGVKVNDRNAWSNQFVTRDGGPELAQSTQVSPTLYYVENVNKVAPRYWTINVDACALGTGGSLTFDLLATPETGVPQSFNTHENNAPYFMYANRDGWTELYAQNHPAYGFYQDNGVGGNVYDLGLPKGLYKLGVRYWDQKGWGSIYPSTRKPQGNVLAYQEYWFRIQSKDGVGIGAARVADSGQQGSDRRTVNDLPPNVFAQVMPNPVSSVLRLQVQGGKGEEVQTTLMDASGRSVLRRQFVPETNTHQEEFGVGELPTGIYFLQVVRAEKQTVLKVVKVE